MTTSNLDFISNFLFVDTRSSLCSSSRLSLGCSVTRDFSYSICTDLLNHRCAWLLLQFSSSHSVITISCIILKFFNLQLCNSQLLSRPNNLLLSQTHVLLNFLTSINHLFYTSTHLSSSLNTMIKQYIILSNTNWSSALCNSTILTPLYSTTLLVHLVTSLSKSSSSINWYGTLHY